MIIIFRSYMIFLGLLYSAVAYSNEQPIPANNLERTDEVFEIRNYHYDPSKFDAYRVWAINEASPFLRDNLDVVGIWIGNTKAPEIHGERPMGLILGSANVTWIIRWDSMKARERAQEEVFGGEEWQNIWNNHPDQKGYLHVEVRFAKEY